jgi:hypothetical protein
LIQGPASHLLRAVVTVAVTALALRAEILEGRVTDGRAPLEGVRVHPDRLRRISPVPVPEARTDREGRFRLELAPGDDVLIVEKDGWQRDLVPRVEWSQPVVLRPAPGFRREPVLLVRVDLPGVACRVSDDELRAMLFGREPGRASAASYLYEVSKGSLLLQEGKLLHLPSASPNGLPTEAMKEPITREVLKALRGMDLKAFDRIDNRTGAARPDGKPDHLWIMVPGPAGSVTAVPEHVHPSCFLIPLPWDKSSKWPVVFLSEEVPLGNIVHEAFHAMGEHRVDDLYKDCGDPATAGIWDLMDAGQYRGWDAHHPAEGPWREDTGYSPSHPGPWVRTELWYRGAFRTLVRIEKPSSRAWTGWLAPLLRAPGADPQRLVFRDPSGKGQFWEFWVSRPWGYEGGRIGGRQGPGRQGLLVARVDPSLLSRTKPKGPVRVLDAHPGTLEPPQPRFPCGRYELDDAAFNLGKGENPKGRDGALAWEVLEQDAAGRMKVSIRWNPEGGG